MADETSHEPTPGLEGAATPNRDRRREPPIIEGERVEPIDDTDAVDAADIGAKPVESPVAESTSAEPPADEAQPVEPAFVEPPSMPPLRASNGRALLSAAIGAVVGAVVAAGGLWFFNPAPAVDADVAARLDKLENSSPAPTAAFVALDKRVGALEADLARGPDKSLSEAYGQRIAALEAGSLSAKAADAALAEAQAARADAAKALALASAAAQNANGAPAAHAGASTDPMNALENRVGKLEAGLASLDRPPVDLGPVKLRLDALETALAAPKNETRAPPQTVAPNRDWAALAIAAQALGDRLREGAPFAAEQAALRRLGADPAALAALNPLAEKGAPTGSRLAADFAKIAPAIVAAGETNSGGAIDRLWANMGKLVRVTPVGEIVGDDPAALISQIEAALARGLIGSALSAWGRLPEPARQASQEWANAAQSRQAADQAARGIVDEAMAQLAAAKD